MSNNRGRTISKDSIHNNLNNNHTMVSLVVIGDGSTPLLGMGISPRPWQQQGEGLHQGARMGQNLWFFSVRNMSTPVGFHINDQKERLPKDFRYLPLVLRLPLLRCVQVSG